MATTDQAAIGHPLEPLTADELRSAVEILRAERDFGERTRFATVALREPPKADVLSFRAGDAIDRCVEFVILDKATGTTYEAVVSLARRDVVEWRAVPGAQPPVLMEEWDDAERAILEHPEWREAARRRGVESFDHVMVDPVSAGNFGFEHERGKRLVRGVAYYRDSPDDNGYAHPIEGLIAVVDLNEKRVVELWDDGTDTLPPTHGRYDAASIGPLVELKPLEIVQPEGAGFTVAGNELRWHKWRFRVALHPREGLVLHTVTWEDEGRVRPVLYRAALSEMVVPYGDPSRAHFWRGVFDAGEYGLGKMANSLELGCDCLGEIHYLDVVFADELGEPTTIRNAICIHEEDAGILWRHFDARSGDTQVVRNRRLVVSCVVTVGNYDYGFYWYFHLDGTIAHEIKATGIMQTQGLRPGDFPEYGSLVAPQLAAMNHQHLFCYRLDVAVDGERNSVYEVDAERVPTGPDNPYGNAMRKRRRLLARETDAQSDLDVASSRHWVIENEGVENALGLSVAYRLLPLVDTALAGALLVAPDSPLRRRAGFAAHNVWVTRYDEDERYAAGTYPNQSLGGEGLEAWQAADRPLENEDVVVWYTAGVTHFPRPEDWPVTPVERCGFMLKPQGFFDRNPALDVARAGGNGHCAHGA